MSFFEHFDVKQIENIELLAKQVVEGFIIGLHKSPFHGFSVEFAEHRLYNDGEATKDIDWKVFARTEKMFTKKFEEETNLRCQIIIDGSSSMYYPDNKDSKLNKLQFSALAAASLMNLFRKQRDAFGLSIFDKDVHTPARSSASHMAMLYAELEKLIDTDWNKQKGVTNAAQSLHHIAEAVHKRSLVVIFSDMFDSTESEDELFSALQHLKFAKHEVLMFHVVDKKSELEFEFENRPYLFIDLESGEEIKLQSHLVKEHYTQKVKAYKDELRMKCLQYKIDFIEADINEGFNPILQSYLIKRNKLK